MLRFQCPVCNAILNVPDQAAGKKGPCPKCGQRLQIPTPARRTMLGRLLPEERRPALRAQAFTEASAEDVEVRAVQSSRWPIALLGLVFLLLAGGLGAVAYLLNSPKMVTKVGRLAEQAGIAKADLTEEQRIVWTKIRRTYQGCVVVVRWDNDSGPWLMYGFEDNLPIWKHELPRSLFKDDFRAFAKRDYAGSKMDYAETVAAKTAARTEVLAVAILDLSSGEKPISLVWYHNDGTGVKRYERPPTEDLGRKMSRLLHELVHDAGRL